MQIKEKIAQIRAKLSSEELEKVNGLLSEIAWAEDDLLATRSEANNESKTRKEKIRELESTIETKTGELEAANNKIAEFDNEKSELIKYKENWESAKAERETANKAKWDEMKKKFDVKETDKGFDQINKLKKYYTLEDDLTPEQVEANIKIANQHIELGLFTPADNPSPPTPKGKPTDPDTKIFNPYAN